MSNENKFNWMDVVVIGVLIFLRVFAFVFFAILYPKLVAKGFKEFVVQGAKRIVKGKVNE